MEVICEHCDAKLNIPDEKVPKDQVVRITCPKCKGKIILDTRKTEPAPSPEEGQELDETGKFHLKFVEKKPPMESTEEAYGYSDYSSDQEMVFFEEGTRLALSMVDNPEREEFVKKAIEQLNYKYIATPNIRDAIGKLRFHHFDLIILMDGFDGQPLEKSALINFINRLSMSVRRRIFLVLLSDQFKTMDDMMAYAMSANVVISTSDVDKLHLILKKAISENERFYKVYTDTLLEIGKG